MSESMINLPTLQRRRQERHMKAMSDYGWLMDALRSKADAPKTDAALLEDEEPKQ